MKRVITLLEAAELIALDINKHKTLEGEISDMDRLAIAKTYMEKAGCAFKCYWKCCSTCGWYALNEEVKKAGYDPEKKTMLFFHAQDAEAITEGAIISKDGLAIRHSIPGEQLQGVLDCLSATGMEVDFEDHDTVIFIKPL